MKIRKIAFRVFFYICISGFVIFSVGPIIWMFLSAFRPKSEFFIMPPSILPKHWTFENFINLFKQTGFARFLLNSSLVTIGTILISTVVASLAAYSLTRFRYRGRNAFIMFSMMAYMLPTVLLVIPMYMIFSKVRLVNSLFGLTLSYIALTLPYCIWLLKAFFASIPFALEEAAAIDGASHIRTLFSVIFPVSLPGIIATSVYSFTYVWNEYMFALVLVDSDAKRTFSVGLNSFITTYDILWEYILAGSVIVSIPAVIVFLLTQKQLIKGFSAGAVKG